MAKPRTIFACSECGNETSKWFGQCPSCKSWNTLYEVEQTPSAPAKRGFTDNSVPQTLALPLREIETTDELRTSTGMAELDRVLGGRTVLGSLVLVGGEPGIGKSTLLLQVSDTFAKQGTVLYVTGEESARQIKLRAERLEVAADALYILAETRMDNIMETSNRIKPAYMIVDSIQTVYKPDAASAPGSVTQIRECAMTLLQYAKSVGVTVFLVGHVTKEGTLAGPKVLEHIVDCVLYFEGDRHASYRILRAVKNRYGSTDEIGVFEMSTRGLLEVPNPSQALLSGRPKDVPGSCIACVMEGTRPLLAEVQALVTQSSFGNPRRTSDGFDYNRAVLLLAVLEKRAGISVSNCDVYLNVTGGLSLTEPAADLPALLAVVSSVRERPLREKMAAFGEVGLTGELRTVSGVLQRLTEIRRLGFTECVVPKRSCIGLKPPAGLTLLAANNVAQAIELAII